MMDRQIERMWEKEWQGESERERICVGERERAWKKECERVWVWKREGESRKDKNMLHIPDRQADRERGWGRGRGRESERGVDMNMNDEEVSRHSENEKYEVDWMGGMVKVEGSLRRGRDAKWVITLIDDIGNSARNCQTCGKCAPSFSCTYTSSSSFLLLLLLLVHLALKSMTV
jgi:hypothetical protein